MRGVSSAGRGGGEGTYHEVLQEDGSSLDLVVRSGSEMARLLEEYGVGAVDLADVDWNVLREGALVSAAAQKNAEETHAFLSGKDAVHDGHVLAAGILGYAEDGDAGFGFAEGGRVGFGGIEAVDVYETSSVASSAKRGDNARHIAIARAPTRPPLAVDPSGQLHPTSWST